jgi:hypothetical protein
MTRLSRYSESLLTRMTTNPRETHAGLQGARCVLRRLAGLWRYGGCHDIGLCEGGTCLWNLELISFFFRGKGTRLDELVSGLGTFFDVY